VDHKPDEPEGREAFEEEASEGSLSPSAELEEAMREAAEAVRDREAHRKPKAGEAEALAAELAEARAELEATKDRLLRLQADFENQRRRVLRDRQEAHKFGHENLVKDLLGSVDNLERAIDHAHGSSGGDFEAMLQGVELVRRELLGALGKHGVTAVEAENEVFDPEVHEAMAQEIDDSVPAGTVVRVFEKGYRIWDRLLRPARVVVSKASDESAGGSGPENG
jgi:molecular chaperone GrpE